LAGLQAAAHVADLADREDDVLRQLGQREHVGDPGLKRLLEQARALARGDEDHRRARVLADPGERVARELRPGRRLQDDVEVPAGERAGGLFDVRARADELEPLVVRERLEDLGQTLARPDRVDPEPLGHLAGAVPTNSSFHSLNWRPSPRIESTVSTVFGLSASWMTGLSTNH